MVRLLKPLSCDVLALITEAKYCMLNLLSSLGPQVQNVTGQVYSGGQRLCRNAETPVFLHVMTVVHC